MYEIGKLGHFMQQIKTRQDTNQELNCTYKFERLWNKDGRAK